MLVAVWLQCSCTTPTPQATTSRQTRHQGSLPVLPAVAKVTGASASHKKAKLWVCYHKLNRNSKHLAHKIDVVLFKPDGHGTLEGMRLERKTAQFSVAFRLMYCLNGKSFPIFYSAVTSHVPRDVYDEWLHHRVTTKFLWQHRTTDNVDRYRNDNSLFVFWIYVSLTWV